MAYKVRELFATLQGEGLNAGRAAVFIRLSGCNLWNGRAKDRAQAQCRFCDTDFVGGTSFAHATALAQAAWALWPDQGCAVPTRPLAVITGGEPALQLDADLIAALKAQGFATVAVETNGTLPLPPGLDWITVSPKAGCDLAVTAGDELKVVWPQDGLDLDQMTRLNFAHFLLQPMDGPDRQANTDLCVRYCLTHPLWRISLQTHKLLGIP